MLIVLDNAADEPQVRLLLPGEGRSAVLVTSRAPLAGLDPATAIRLDALPPAEALALLGSLAGRGRVEAEPQAAEAIVRLCGYLPLAVRIAGAKLAAKPHMRLAPFAEQLTHEHRRLDALQVGDLDLRACFAMSYKQLTTAQRRLFRLLSLLVAADFPAWVSAALLDCAVADATDLTEGLESAQLLEAVGEDSTGQLRYRFHDLLRVFARELAHRGESQERRKASLRQVIGGYLSLAAAATDIFDQGRQHLALRTEARKWSVDDPIAAEAAHDLPVEWFTTERANLLALIEQAYEQELWAMTWELADCLDSFLVSRGYWSDRRRTCEIALQAAHQANNRRWQAKMLFHLGSVHSDQARWEEALQIFGQAQKIFEELGDTSACAWTAQAFGLVYRRQGRLSDAMAQYEQCLAVFEQIGDRSQAAFVHIGMADVHRARGQLDDAMAHDWVALPIHKEEGNLIGEVFALNDLAEIARDRGDLDAALAYLQQSLEAVQRSGNRLWTARTLMTLGAICGAMGRLDRAMEHFDEALAGFQDIGDRRSEAMLFLERSQALLLAKGGDTRERLGDALSATDQYLALFREIGDPFWTARAMRHKGEILTALGRHDEASECLRHAQEIAGALI